MSCEPSRPPSPEPPRYLRFVTALVLGTAIAVAPAVLTGCDDGPPPVDAGVVDANVVDAWGVVDGPLPPPDLPRLA